MVLQKTHTKEKIYADVKKGQKGVPKHYFQTSNWALLLLQAEIVAKSLWIQLWTHRLKHNTYLALQSVKIIVAINAVVVAELRERNTEFTNTT
jgi:hypothetical protein